MTRDSAPDSPSESSPGDENESDEYTTRTVTEDFGDGPVEVTVEAPTNALHSVEHAVGMAARRKRRPEPDAWTPSLMHPVLVLRSGGGTTYFMPGNSSGTHRFKKIVSTFDGTQTGDDTAWYVDSKQVFAELLDTAHMTVQPLHATPFAEVYDIDVDEQALVTLRDLRGACGDPAGTDGLMPAEVVTQLAEWEPHALGHLIERGAEAADQASDDGCVHPSIQRAAERVVSDDE